MVATSAGCSFQEPASWADQLSPDGPCWRVDLLDGLDTSSTGELHDLYACLSRQGAFQPLAPVVDALDGDSRAGVPLGVELAILVNGLSTVGLDVWALAGVGLDLLRAPEHPLETALELGVELVYGRPYEVVVDEVDLGAGDELDRGVIAPLLPVVADGARVALDSDDAIPALLGAMAEDPALADLACSIAGLATSTDPEVADLGERIVADLGDGLQRVTDASNDHHPDASGNSLRDLVRVSLVQRGDDGQTLLDATSPDILAIVQDSRVVANLAETLADARDARQLALLPAQLRYLATVDVAGDGLDPDEDSALTALLRLLDQANTEVDCSVDLTVIQFDFSLGNLSVALLSALADQEPTTAASGVDLLGDLLGLGLTESTLELVADSGLCPVIDRQLVEDLQSIDRLSDPQVYDLLVNLLRVLDDLRSGEEDRLPATVDLVSEMVQRGVVPPLEELVRDIGGAAIAADLVESFGLVLEPAALQVEACPADSHPVDLSGALGLVRATLDDRSGGAPVGVVQPLLDQVLGAEGTWVAIDHFGALARFDDSRVHSLLPLVVQWLEVDPDLELSTDLAALLSDPTLSGPALRIAEDSGLIDAIAATPPTSDGPLPWAARAVVDGTVQAILATVDLVVETLRDARTARSTPPPATDAPLP